MLRRSYRLYGDFRSTPKLADEFSASISRQSSKYDHVLIDVGPFASIGTRVVKGLNGHDRDLETITFIQRQIFGVVLRKYSAAKSIGLFFDGSDPLWKPHRTRRFANKKFEDRFYRSCACNMSFLCEERLRTAIADTARGKILPEFTISGPGTAGPVEAKMSAYLYDLAARFVDTEGGAAYNNYGDLSPATKNFIGQVNASTTFTTVQPTDSVLIVGMDEAFLSALGALPFSNVTAVLMDGRDLKSLTMAEGLEWMTMQNLGKPATPQPGATLTLQQQKARVDAMILYMLGNGCSATELSGVGINFSDLMNAYNDTQNMGTAGGNYLCDLTAPSVSAASTSSTAAPARTTVGIDIVRLERLLSKAGRKMASAAREDAQAADYLEVLLQSVAMFADGGIKNYGYVPVSPLVEAPAQMKLDQLLGHLKFLAGESAGNTSKGGKAVAPATAAASTATANAVVTDAATSAKIAVPTASDFALTAAEQLLVSGSTIKSPPAAEANPTVAAIKAISPTFLGGWEVPEAVLADITSTADVKAAAETARDVLSFLDPNSEAGSHPALRNQPSYYYYQTKTVGPPAGYEYAAVNLGRRSAEQGTRAAFVGKCTSV